MLNYYMLQNKFDKNSLVRVLLTLVIYKDLNVYHLVEDDILLVLSYKSWKKANRTYDYCFTMYNERIGVFEWSGNNISLNGYFEKIC